MKNKPLPEWNEFEESWLEDRPLIPAAKYLSKQYGPFYEVVYWKYVFYSKDITTFKGLYITLKKYEPLRESKLFDIIMDLT